MYLGRIVEMGLAENIAHQPRHPYTGILWSSLADKQTTEVTGAVTNVAVERERRTWGVFDFEQPTSGCRFRPALPAVTKTRAAPPSAPTLRPSRS